MISIYPDFLQNDRICLIEELEKRKSQSSTDMISFYGFGPVGPKIDKCKNQLDEAKNIKSKKTQNAVLEGLNTLLQALRIINKKGFLSYSIFIHKKEAFIINLIESIKLNLYHCSNCFYLSPIQEYSDFCWGLVVIDNKEFSIGILKNNIVTLLENQDVFIPRKIKAGGQSAQRFEETRKNLVLNSIKQVSERCNELFEPYKPTKILLGGIIPTSDFFYNQNHLVPKYKQILDKPTPTQYTNPFGLNQLLERKKSLYQNLLRAYNLEKKKYEQIMLNFDNLITFDGLRRYESYKILKAYVITNTTGLKYCNYCKNLFCNNLEHKKESLKDLLEPSNYYVFDYRSDWAKKIKHNQSFFEIVEL